MTPTRFDFTYFEKMNTNRLYFNFLLCLSFIANTASITCITAQPIGMVSTAHPLATDAGFKILEAGGNAFDAAVAIAATLNVVEPMMSGMGGYGTILVYHAETGTVRFLDSSGKIPVNTNSDLMRAPTPNWKENRFGAKSISTPGNVNAWDAMSSEYGNLKWIRLFDQAIILAENGFKASKRTEAMIGYGWDDMPEHAKAFYGIKGNPIKEGELLIQRDLANSLRTVAKKGRAAFYEGELAEKIISTMQEEGSFLSQEDLTNDRAEWWAPISIDYKGYQVYTASPPANSFPGLIRLGLMSQFEDRDLKHNSEEYLHLFAESTKHAFWCRLRYAGDPETNPPPMDMLLSEKYWNEVASGFDDQNAKDFEPPTYVAPTGKNTTHFVVADKWGNIVSATQTLGNLFGSKIMPEGTGIWLNNSLAYCTYEPKGNPMDAIPGQRKLSGDCPVIIFKNKMPFAALGTPGGHTIAQTVPQMIMNLIDFDMDIQEAISAPRVSFIEPNTLAIEEGVSDEVFEALRLRGHDVKRTRALGNAHGLTIQYDTMWNIIGFEGGADPRGEGTAAVGIR